MLTMQTGAAVLHLPALITELVPVIPDDEFSPGFGAAPPGFAAFGGIVALVIIAGIGFGIYRMVLVARASERLGLQRDETFLAVTDEHGSSAVIAAAAVKEAIDGRAPSGATLDLSARLGQLQSALDAGLISPEEYEKARQAILDSV